jgi:hypothetical protein
MEWKSIKANCELASPTVNHQPKGLSFCVFCTLMRCKFLTKKNTQNTLIDWSNIRIT